MVDLRRTAHRAWHCVLDFRHMQSPESMSISPLLCRVCLEAPLGVTPGQMRQPRLFHVIVVRHSPNPRRPAGARSVPCMHCLCSRPSVGMSVAEALLQLRSSRLARLDEREGQTCGVFHFRPNLHVISGEDATAEAISPTAFCRPRMIGKSAIASTSILV